MTSKCVTLPGYGGTDQAGAMLSEDIGDLVAPVNQKSDNVLSTFNEEYIGGKCSDKSWSWLDCDSVHNARKEF